ncbi:(2,3-dihydroxybenzoyl)adenylate synthase [Psychromonas sp. Urea-02u-13]|uniref:(2,3-dihydroxybenzoyl)adenylate synthase n=1 Tax=Psychromonas sp. Urea-02u-13 TaxID=2058326 RepID=UPI000C3335CD|nr:AMP-binding protein [Psychromonas sp. Urea-02u-13]PKG39108.1 2,3-dihydroxybenzoate-AMP ligase [Psychromonas sp. Urea-02u-13]
MSPLQRVNNEDLLEGFVPYSTDQQNRYEKNKIFENTPLWSILTDNVKLQETNIAIKDDVRSMTFKELLISADNIAAQLQQDGLIQGDRVVLQMLNSCDFVIYFFALQRAGLVPIMALPAHGITEIRHFVDISQAKGYICDGKENTLCIADELQHNSSSITHVYTVTPHAQYRSLNNIEKTLFSPPKIDPNSPALFLVSGGTTGLPKLIPRTHNDYLFNIKICAQASHISAEDIYLAVLPAAHNFTLGCPGILGVLSLGGKVVFSDNPGPDYCFDLIEKNKITCTALVPALAQIWTEATEWEGADISSLCLLQVGGSKLSYSDAIAIQHTFPNTLQQVFGMAEGLIVCTAVDDNPDTIATTQGYLISQWDEIRIVDTKGNLVADGEEGELLTRGPTTLRGYYRAPENNLHSFTHDGFYRSGDKVKMDTNQCISVTGRIKDVINKAGECIATDEIEEYLLSHPKIAQVAVVAVPDKYLGERIGVALICKDELLTLQDLRHFLRSKHLAAFKMPDELNIVHSLPKTAVGKIDKKRIPGPDGKPWIGQTFN